MPQATGTINFIGTKVQVNETFSRLDFAIEVKQFNPETEEVWSHEEAFQLANNNISILEKFPLGTRVKVSYNVRSNKTEKEGELKYFTNLTAYRIEAAPINNAAQSQQGQSGSDAGQAPATPF